MAVFIDGRQPASTRTFFDRPDVRATLHEASPAGWRVPLDTTGLAPGEHRLTVLAWASEKGKGYYLAERKLTVRAAEEVKPAAGESLDFETENADGDPTSALTVEVDDHGAVDNIAVDANGGPLPLTVALVLGSRYAGHRLGQLAAETGDDQRRAVDVRHAEGHLRLMIDDDELTVLRREELEVVGHDDLSWVECLVE